MSNLLLCLNINDLIVLHGWTLFVITFADAKVVKHVEPVIRDRTIVKMKKMYFLTNFSNTPSLLSLSLPVNLDKLLEEHDASGAVAFCI